ncbi:MAG TPA: hypothetical protein ENI17_09015 [Pseudomonas xinjiangensis]|uniref:Uncharacterized protein n=2 Tax=root TaxID=1 RepID=A0A7V1BKQ2_9GAMM|nr:hypothetical protein [Halopseudomonas xinjiangensis]HEC47755.1 hypothetical protein [Halopseudomonas xinjiangensis]
MSVVSALRVTLIFLLAVLVATILATVVQTQVNLYDLEQIGTDISTADRLGTTGKDLINFFPLMCLLVTLSFIFALPAAELVGRILKPWRTVVYLLAGAVGIWVAFQAVNAYVPPPVFIAATRQSPGTLAMMAGVAIGSGLFALLTRPKARRGLRVLG